MKMISTWFRAGRGLAVGTIVGALTIGKALPYGVQALPGLGVERVVWSTTVAGVVAATLVVVGYRDGPYPFPPRAFSWKLVATVVRQRHWRLATGGYLGHMWELYACWTWLPVFVAASLTRRGVVEPSSLASAIGAASIAIGGLGCLWGGVVGDRRGREWLVTVAMVGSGFCATIIGLAFGGPVWLVVAIGLVWGFFVVADSAQFSVLVTESVPPHAVGTALTLQVCSGFLLTMASIQLVPKLQALIGWQWAFVVLAIGPALGIVSIARLRAHRARTS
jgi:hypothetical protein